MPLVDRLPEHLKSRKTAEAITAPSAILLAGAGASLGILGGLPLVAAALVGLGAYAARVAFGLPRRPRRERIELASLPEPWRNFVREALDAQRRYRKACSSAQPGPLRDRLTEIGQRIDQGVHEVYRVARRGAALEGGLTTVDAGNARRELAEIVNGMPSEIRSGLERVIESGEDVAELGGLGGDVDALVGEMEALREELEDAGKASRGDQLPTLPEPAGSQPQKRAARRGGGGTTATGTA